MKWELIEESISSNGEGRRACEVHNQSFQTQQRANSQRDCNLFKSNVAIKRFIAAVVSGA